MTTSDIIDTVRRFVQDTVQPYRWSDAELVKDLRFAVRELHKIRPETRYVLDRTSGRIALVDCVDIPTDRTATIDIEDRFEECLAYYVAYLAYLDDNPDTANANLAEMFLQKFNTKAQL